MARDAMKTQAEFFKAMQSQRIAAPANITLLQAVAPDVLDMGPVTGAGAYAPLEATATAVGKSAPAPRWKVEASPLGSTEMGGVFGSTSIASA
eukprot:5133565-Amphidinium_carterae.1